MFLGLKITDETLEDRLAFDEIFVEYFNAFLALPVSMQVMLLIFNLSCHILLFTRKLNNPTNILRYTYISFLGCLNLV